MGGVASKSFEKSDETRSFEHGKVDVVHLAGSTAGQATFEPGWRWSTSVKPIVGTDSCQGHHLGYVLSGTLHVMTDEGDEVDIDVLDPAAAPGTGTPEPGGMLARELLRAVRQIASSVELVGMDVVEVSPPYDHAEITAAAAHRCVLEALSALAAKKPV